MLERTKRKITEKMGEALRTVVIGRCIACAELASMLVGSLTAAVYQLACIIKFPNICYRQKNAQINVLCGPALRQTVKPGFNLFL